MFQIVNLQREEFLKIRQADHLLSSLSSRYCLEYLPQIGIDGVLDVLPSEDVCIDERTYVLLEVLESEAFHILAADAVPLLFECMELVNTIHLILVYEEQTNLYRHQEAEVLLLSYYLSWFYLPVGACIFCVTGWST